MKPRLALALAVGSALVLVALAARGTSPVVFGSRAGGDGAPEVVQTPSREVDSEVGGSAVAGSLVVVLIVLISVVVVSVIALVFAFGGFRWRRRRGIGVVVEPPDGQAGGAEVPAILVRGATEALEELRGRGSGPPGDAVVAAWLTLERAAGAGGVPRLGHQTPTEFTGDLLSRYRVDEHATSTLRRVYQRARFGTAGVTEADARTAAEALAHIVRDLR